MSKGKALDLDILSTLVALVQDGTINERILALQTLSLLNRLSIYGNSEHRRLLKDISDELSIRQNPEIDDGFAFVMIQDETSRYHGYTYFHKIGDKNTLSDVLNRIDRIPIVYIQTTKDETKEEWIKWLFEALIIDKYEHVESKLFGGYLFKLSLNDINKIVQSLDKLILDNNLDSIVIANNMLRASEKEVYERWKIVLNDNGYDDNYFKTPDGEFVYFVTKSGDVHAKSVATKMRSKTPKVFDIETYDKMNGLVRDIQPRRQNYNNEQTYYTNPQINVKSNNTRQYRPPTSQNQNSNNNGQYKPPQQNNGSGQYRPPVPQGNVTKPNKVTEITVDTNNQNNKPAVNNKDKPSIWNGFGGTPRKKK